VASEWESKVGYSRVVRAGAQVFVAGTTAAGPDAYSQSIAILKIIQQALESQGASLRDVVRTRMFVTDIGNWEQIGRAHSEFFDDIRPAATMVEVSRLIAPELLVEIEVDAVIRGAATG
jgi:enamine deaminase RidA (YjgF/YER057c/UK114 family)